MSLAVYNKKRNFDQTSEPHGKADADHQFRFVVQEHHASRLHWDFRLELGGVLKSWAVPKGPDMEPGEKRLAVKVEDHPVSYIDFKGTIPEGNYGAGKVKIWDKGLFQPIDEKSEALSEKQALQWLKKGELKVALSGKKLKGEYVLVDMHKGEKNWLLIRHKKKPGVVATKDPVVSKAATTRKTASTKTTRKSAPGKTAVVKKKPADEAIAIPSIRYGKGKKFSHFIHPMLASITPSAFDDAGWLFEIKWDGYRAIAETGKKDIRFYSRNGLDFSGRFAAIYEALRAFPKKAVLDGEIVLLNENGVPDFQKLQNYEANRHLSLLYCVFDMLELEGKDMRSLPLTDRKALLKKYLGKKKLVRYCDHIDTDGVAFLAKAKDSGLEGIIAKAKDSTYADGYRSKQWLKIKNSQSAEAVIVGYTAPKGGRTHFGSLVLAGKKGKQWIYRGHVGTGFNQELLVTLKKEMDKLKTQESPFAQIPPVNGEVTWLQPKMVAEIAYTEITADGSYRHPSFLRLRSDKSSRQLNEEITMTKPTPKKAPAKKAAAKKTPAKKAAQKKATPTKATPAKVADKYTGNSNRQPVLTNLDKIYWPKEKYTKGDLIDYYESVSKFILPHLKDRPLSLKRNPNGINDKGFFHKDAGENAPGFVKVFPVDSESSNKTIDYIVCNNPETLLYVANLGCIEMNPWNSTIQKPDQPTWLVIDIDPSDKNDFTQVVETAKAVKDITDKAGINGYCKTSGATGLHVYIPLKNNYAYDLARDFAQVIASLVQELVPDFTTLERSLKKRGPNIYIDYLQNRPGQTLSSAYSVRPVPGACVSTPLEWKEVNQQLHPSQFTIKNILQRLQKKGDLFSKVLTEKTDIRKALKNLGA